MRPPEIPVIRIQEASWEVQLYPLGLSQELRPAVLRRSKASPQPRSNVPQETLCTPVVSV